MYRRSKETRKMAWELLRKHYWNVLAFTVIASLIAGAGLVGLIIGGPILVGAAHLTLKTIRDDDSTQFELLFKEFDNFGRQLGVHILALLKIFLWTLLFIIPGIVRAYSLSQIYFIAKERPDLEANEVLKQSTQMMRGHRFRLFKLHFSFIGWYLLCILTFGIGFIFLMPYARIAEGLFYQELIDLDPDRKKAELLEVFE